MQNHCRRILIFWMKRKRLWGKTWMVRTKDYLFEIALNLCYFLALPSLILFWKTSDIIGEDEEGEGIDLQQYPWEGSDRDYEYEEVTTFLNILKSLLQDSDFILFMCISMGGYGCFYFTYVDPWFTMCSFLGESSISSVRIILSLLEIAVGQLWGHLKFFVRAQRKLFLWILWISAKRKMILLLLNLSLSSNRILSIIPAFDASYHVSDSSGDLKRK